MSLKTRFCAVIALAILGLLAFATFWLSTERSRILSEKQEKLKSLVETAHSVVADRYQLQQNGLPQTEAQKQAMQLLKSMRYQGDNYFWINDLRPSMVMHPTKPTLDGTELSTLRDPNGKALFVEMAEAVRRNGQGFVAYEWPRPGSAQPVPKLSFVKGFAPWGWVIGTGIYIDDVDAIWRANALKALLLMALLLAVMSAAAVRAYQRLFRPLNRVVECMQDVAQGDGDLTKRLDVPPDREVAELARWFNTFMDRLQSLLVVVADNVQNLAAAGEEISVTSRQQSESANQQKDQTQQVAVSMQEMNSAVQQVTDTSSSASETAQKASDSARRGGRVVDETLARMRSIAESTTSAAQKIEFLGKQSEQIGRIIGVIDEIADQTNLLALNAAIEAARAGDQGRGFAVVADEVRKLAERTTGATKEITQMITGVQEGTRLAVSAMQDGSKEVELGVTATREAGSALKEIINYADRVGEMVTHIALAASQQSSSADNVKRSSERIADLAASTANGAVEATKAMEDLARLAGDIQKQVGQFRLTSQETGGRSAHSSIARAASSGV
ncbi:MAG TPA: methyl-accepting chemotaxis protein [Candidatus Solibacter sp.]|nr:methyl-accepting chemotaxis protein [Candidatus Solibacter sp.]